MSGLRLQKFLGNLLATVAGQASNTLAAVLTVPAFLNVFGADRYGEYLVLSAACAQLQMLVGGIHLTAVNTLTTQIATGEIVQYRKTITSFLTVLLSVCILISAATIGALRTFPLASALHLHRIEDGEAKQIVILMLSGTLLSFCTSLLVAIPRTYDEFHVTQWIDNGYRLSISVGTIVAVLQKRTFVEISAIPLICSICVSIPMLCYGEWKYGILAAVSPRSALQTVRRHRKNVAGYAGIAIGVTVSQQLGLIVLSAYVSSASVAAYVAYRTLTNVIRQGLSVFGNSMWPELTRLYAQRRVGELKETFTKYAAVGIIASLTALSILSLAGQSILEMWTGKGIIFDLTMFHALLIQAGIASIWMVLSVLLLATDQFGLLGKCYLGSSLLGCAIAAVCGKVYPAPSLSIGLALGELIVCYGPVIAATKRILESDQRRELSIPARPGGNVIEE